MKLFIRADANNIIATGHIMRCIAIAQAAIELGHKAIFIVADDDSKELLERHNMEYICLNSIWNQMDNEIECIYEVIDRERPDYILVDSYYVTESYLENLKRKCKVAYIDDLGEMIYPCDTLISYAGYYDKFNYEKRYSNETNLLLGMKYVPLRKEYENIDKVKCKCFESKINILIMTGGTDNYHIIDGFLEEWQRKTNNTLSVNIVAICGKYNIDYDNMKKKYAHMSNVKLVKTAESLKEYMLAADIAISASGTTLFELCACGTPTICYTLADNQISNATWFLTNGYMMYAGDVRDDNVVLNIVNEIEELLRNDKKRKLLSQKMFKSVDGKGAKRIVREISECIKKL